MYINLCCIFERSVFNEKIINKKVYDTETAEFVAEYHNGYFRRDFRYEYEGLYKSKKGQFFIHGIGEHCQSTVSHMGMVEQG